MPEKFRAPRGLYDVIVADTSISKSSSDGTLIYSGYDINDLANHASFEETAYLILNGNLPSAPELKDFHDLLSHDSVIPPEIPRLLELFPRSAHPIDMLRTCVSLIGSLVENPSGKNSHVSLAAKFPSLVASIHSARNGLPPPVYNQGENYSDNLLAMLTGSQLHSFERRSFEQVMLFYLEHDLNASTFTTRVVASTQADVFAAITSALAALKGPLHGGANEAALGLQLAASKQSSPESYIDELLSQGKKVPGFGHRVYKTVDPRAQFCKALFRKLSEAKSSTDYYEVCAKIEARMWEKKKLPANLDFYAAPIFYLLDLPVETYTSIFAASRVFGWVAHYNEQLRENKIIRPDADYIGPKGLKYIPLAQRGPLPRG
jgi:citrate synthase